MPKLIDKQLGSYWTTVIRQSLTFAFKEAAMKIAAITLVVSLVLVVIVAIGASLGIITADWNSAVITIAQGAGITFCGALLVMLVLFLGALYRIPAQIAKENQETITAIQGQLESRKTHVPLEVSAINDPQYHHWIKVLIRNPTNYTLSHVRVYLGALGRFQMDENGVLVLRSETLSDHNRYFNQIEFIDGNSIIVGGSQALVKIAEVPVGTEIFRWLLSEPVAVDNNVLEWDGPYKTATYELQLQIQAQNAEQPIEPQNYSIHVTFELYIRDRTGNPTTELTIRGEVVPRKKD